MSETVTASSGTKDGALQSPHRVSGAIRYPCRQCGARLEYQPGSKVLKCPYCQAENPIVGPAQVVEEIDYQSTLAELASSAPKHERKMVHCEGCHSELDPPANVTAFACPFCGSNIVATSARSASSIVPGGVLPFQVTRDEAVGRFRQWLGSRWFAPSALKRQGFIDASISGTYLPAWTYDAQTLTRYTGERGDAYYETQWVTINGKRQATQVRRVRWSPASGAVNNAFDDVLVMATRSLPEKKLDGLMPWDLNALVAYQDDYLAGFRSECYSVKLDEGFETAKRLMQPEIVSTIRAAIGGDEQRIHTMSTQYSGVTFKHLLLPVWISAYRYSGKVYQFVVNARTGEVDGDRPYSALKIALFVMMCVAIVIVTVVIASAGRG